MVYLLIQAAGLGCTDIKMLHMKQHVVIYVHQKQRWKPGSIVLIKLYFLMKITVLGTFWWGAWVWAASDAIPHVPKHISLIYTKEERKHWFCSNHVITHVLYGKIYLIFPCADKEADWSTIENEHEKAQRAVVQLYTSTPSSYMLLHPFFLHARKCAPWLLVLTYIIMLTLMVHTGWDVKLWVVTTHKGSSQRAGLGPNTWL